MTLAGLPSFCRLAFLEHLFLQERATNMYTPRSFSRRTLLCGAMAATVAACTSDLIERSDAKPARSIRETFTLRTDYGRAVQVSDWVPGGRKKGTVIFSHGALSAPWYYDRILQPVMDAGYRVLAPLHVDSSEHPLTSQFPGLASWRCRIEDAQLLIEHLGNDPFIAMGHSYGGLVATVLGGAAGVRPDGIRSPLVPRLAKAVVALSPPAPIPAMMTAKGYGSLQTPALIQTGTLDAPPSAGPDAWRGHLAPFEAAAPGGHRFGLVLQGGDHYFGGAICDFAKPGPMQLAALQEANAIIGLFLEAYGSAAKPAAAARLRTRVTDEYPTRLLWK